MPSRQIRTSQFLLIALAATLAAAVGFSRTFYDVATINPFMWWVLLGVVIIHLRVRRSSIDASLVVALCGLFVAFAQNWRGLEAGVAPVRCYAGLASFTVLLVRTICARTGDSARATLLPAVVACCFLVGFLYVAASMLFYAEQLQPRTLDLYLLSFDGSLGFQPSFLAGTYYWGFPWLRRAAFLAYEGLPLALALTFAENLTDRRARAASVGLGMFYLGVFGILAYSLFPAAGPVHLFGGLFPAHPLASEQARTLPLSAIPVRGPRNAIPSLHMAWILWCWWSSRGLKTWVKVLMLWFVLFTVVSTLGTGEHYLIDLVVAFPFTLMLLAAFSLGVGWIPTHRLTALLSGGGMVLIWFALLRYTPKLFWLSPAIPWSLIVTTIALVYWLKLRLQEAQDASAASLPPTRVPAFSSAVEEA